MSVTGRLAVLLPAGPARDEMMGLVRLGVAFSAQHRGRRPGLLAQYVSAKVQTLDRPTFDALLTELELDAVRRELRGPQASPIEKVCRAWEVVTWHDPKHGRRQCSFKRLRNIARLKESRDPLTRESDSIQSS